MQEAVWDVTRSGVATAAGDEVWSAAQRVIPSIVTGAFWSAAREAFSFDDSWPS